MARDAAGSVGGFEGRGHKTSVTLLDALHAFFQEHERCGGPDSGLDGDRVWMACTCGAVIKRPLGSAT